MKKIVSLLLSLMLICTMGMAMADTVDAGVVEPGTQLTIKIELTAVSGEAAVISIVTDGAPVEFVDAEGGEVNDVIPPNTDPDSGLKGTFQVVNMPNASIDKNGNVSGSGLTPAALVTGHVANLTIKVSDTAAAGIYKVYTKDDLGACTVDGAVTFTVESTRLAGDVNDDGVVDMRDSITLDRYFAEWDGVTINESNADVNADGFVDMRDSIILDRYFAEWEGVELK